MLLRKVFHRVKVKYGSNQLAKIVSKDESSYIAPLSIANTWFTNFVIVVFLFRIFCFNRLPVCLINYMPVCLNLVWILLCFNRLLSILINYNGLRGSFSGMFNRLCLRFNPEPSFSKDVDLQPFPFWFFRHFPQINVGGDSMCFP